MSNRNPALGSNRIAHIRTLLKTLPLTRRRFIPAAGADEQPESGTWEESDRPYPVAAEDSATDPASV